MSGGVFRIPKRSGTPADVLLAYGVARFLEALGGSNVRLRDEGPFYAVEADPPVSAGALKGAPPPVLFPFVAEEKAQPPAGFPHVVNAAEVRLQRQEARAARALGREEQRLTPEEEMSLFVAETRMQFLPLHNRLAQNGYEALKALGPASVLQALEGAFAGGMDPDKALRSWGKRARKAVPGLKPEETASQVLNPHQGKGQNRPKPKGVEPHNLNSPFLGEYLKAVGLWTCAVPRSVRGARMGDRKVYVLAPLLVDMVAHEEVYRKFSGALRDETSVKMDCLASLELTDVLLDHSWARQEGFPPPDRVMGGLYVVHYALLNPRSYTMVGLGFLRLPAWAARAQTPGEVEALRDLVREHRRVVQAIQEDRSEGYNLLVRYRDFLSSGRLEDLLAFFGGFAGYLMARLYEARRDGRRPHHPTFTTKGLDRMLYNLQEVSGMQGQGPLMEIVRTPGFRNIARAIRQSTVTLQYLAANDQYDYEIRYGLAQELLRKSHRNDEFARALAAFVQRFNAENARKAEEKAEVWRRASVSEEDLDQVLALVDRYGAELVAHLLVAYGYAREGQQEGEAEQKPEEEVQG